MNQNKTKFQRVMASALAAALTVGSMGVAFAQRPMDRHDNDRRDNDRQEQRRDNDRQEQRHEYQRRAEMNRGAGPEHNYWVGRRLPQEYRSRSYVVDDWRGHHLRQPPRGYHWVQSGGDYLLVAVATGLIASAILNN